jgi:hypothetical protein
VSHVQHASNVRTRRTYLCTYQNLKGNLLRVVSKQVFTLLDLTELVHHQVVQHVHDEVEMGVIQIKFLVGRGTGAAVVAGTVLLPCLMLVLLPLMEMEALASAETAEATVDEDDDAPSSPP